MNRISTGLKVSNAEPRILGADAEGRVLFSFVSPSGSGMGNYRSGPPEGNRIQLTPCNMEFESDRCRWKVSVRFVFSKDKISP